MFKILIYFANTLYLLTASICLADDDQKGLPQLDFSTYPSLIFWSLFSLFLLFIIMSLLISPKIDTLIKNRHQSIQNDLLKAKSDKQKADELILEINHKLEKSRNDARKLIEKSLTESNLLIEKSDKEINTKIKNQLDNSVNTIIKNKNSKISEISKEYSSISVLILKKVLDIDIEKSSIEQISKNLSKQVLKEI